MIASMLVVARWYPSFDRPGSGTFVADQVRALRALGIDLTVASFDNVGMAGDRTNGTRIDAVEALWASAVRAPDAVATPRRWGAGVPVARLPVIKTWRSQTGADTAEIIARHQRVFLAFGRALAERAARSGRPIEAIHAHTGVPDGLIAARLAKELGVGLVVSEHDSTLPERLADAATQDAYRELFETAQVAVVSHAFAHRIQAALGAAGVGEHALHVVPNVVPTSVFRPMSDAVDRDADELLWVGARSRHKGMETLLRATALARASRPALHLRLIGSTKPADEAEWVALAATLGIAENVRFEPETDRSGVAAAMQRAGIFVHPSPWETFGMVAAESLAAGLPVAATPSGGVEEILGATGEAGEIAAGSTPEALAEAILRLRARLAEIDRAALPGTVERRFAPDVVATRLLELHGIARDRIRGRMIDPPAQADAADRPTHADRGSDELVTPVATDAFLVVARRRAAAERAAVAASTGSLTTRLVGAVSDGSERATTAGGALRLPRRILSAALRRVMRQSAPSAVDRYVAGIRSGWLELAGAPASTSSGQSARVHVVPVEIEDLELAQQALGDVAGLRLAPGSLRWLADHQDAAGEAMGR